MQTGSKEPIEDGEHSGEGKKAAAGESCGGDNRLAKRATKTLRKLKRSTPRNAAKKEAKSDS